MSEDKIKKYSAIIAERVPVSEKTYWSFSDDDVWIDIIDSLKVEDVIGLWNAEVPNPEGGLGKRKLRDIVQARVGAALRDVQARFLKRDSAIEMMVACAIAQVNMVFLGRPGTAKSQVVRSFAQSLGMRPSNVPIKQEEKEVDELVKSHLKKKEDAERRRKGLPPLQDDEGAKKDGKEPSLNQKRRFFEYLLTRYTTPEELFGGTDIQVLLQTGVFCRRTEGLLPQAEIAFLDEIFKANGAILNALLSLVNERIYYNMGRAFKVNMAFVVGASNETPDVTELGALYDRFPMRVPVFNVSDTDDDINGLLKKSHQGECRERLHIDRDSGSGTSRITRKACLNDIRLLSKFLLGAAFGGVEEFSLDGQDEEFRKLFNLLFVVARREYDVSDRTPAQVLRVCRALALLDGSPQLKIEHLRAWAYVAPDIDSLVSLQKHVEAMLVKADNSLINKLFKGVGVPGSGA